MKLQLLGRDGPAYRASNGTFAVEAMKRSVSGAANHLSRRCPAGEASLAAAVFFAFLAVELRGR